MTTATRTFQPKQRDEHQDIWYSPVPIDVMWGIYARQSTVAQLTRNLESTEMQTDDLINWLVAKGVRDGHWKLFDADLGMSGTLRIDQRTGLQELLELIKADVIKAVLVYQISRLFRDDTGVQYNTFADECRKHNCVLVTADGMVFNFHNRMHLKMFRFLAEYAAEYIPQQIGLLHAARLRKARKGYYAGLGSVPRGYMVDYNRDNATYKKLIPYWPQGTPALSLFERYYSLCGDFSALCREVEQMPYVFPNFDSTVDRRNIRDKRWKKVPGGYHISRRGLLWLLTNPVYIGWWIIEGDIISTSNHEPIIDKENEYLFWYAFERLSPFTTSGEVNIDRKVAPRRFYQRDTDEQYGLLKDRIAAPTGTPIRVHLSEGVHTYSRPKTNTKVFDCSDSEIEVDLVDAEFIKRMFAHLHNTHDFDGFRTWYEEVVKKQQSHVEIITSQLAEVENLQEALLDAQLTIFRNINEQIKEAVAHDPATDTHQLKEQLEKEAAQDLERLEKRKAKYDALERELRSQLPDKEEDEEMKTARTFADFQTELENLNADWQQYKFKEKKEYVNLLVKKAVLSVVATHWIQLDIHWVHPLWQCETLFIYRRRGERITWTDEHRNLLKAYYESAERKTLLSLLPHKSWNAIKKEAVSLGLHRHSQPSLDIDDYTTWSDWQFSKEHGIAINTRDTIRVELAEPKLPSGCQTSEILTMIDSQDG